MAKEDGKPEEFWRPVAKQRQRDLEHLRVRYDELSRAHRRSKKAERSLQRTITELRSELENRPVAVSFIGDTDSVASADSALAHEYAKQTTELDRAWSEYHAAMHEYATIRDAHDELKIQHDLLRHAMAAARTAILRVDYITAGGPS